MEKTCNYGVVHGIFIGGNSEIGMQIMSNLGYLICIQMTTQHPTWSKIDACPHKLVQKRCYQQTHKKNNVN